MRALQKVKDLAENPFPCDAACVTAPTYTVSDTWQSCPAGVPVRPGAPGDQAISGRPLASRPNGLTGVGGPRRGSWAQGQPAGPARGITRLSRMALS